MTDRTNEDMDAEVMQLDAVKAEVDRLAIMAPVFYDQERAKIAKKLGIRTPRSSAIAFTMKLGALPI